MSTTNLPQPMRPHGLGGRLFAVVMEVVAAPNYRWVIGQLRASPPKSYLEIGFGTGKLMGMVADTFRPERICGADPSELMFEQTSRRLRAFGRKHALDLKLGDNTLLASWPDGTFDAIVASHSWQFWTEPEETLRRLSAKLAPGGRLVMAIRHHISRNVIPWLPNAISKSGDELGGLRAALAAAGLRIVADEKLRSGSHGIVARH